MTWNFLYNKDKIRFSTTQESGLPPLSCVEKPGLMSWGFGRFLLEMPRQQNRRISRDPAQVQPRWHKMDLNLRHKDWVKPAGGAAFLFQRVIYFFPLCVRALVSPGPFFVDSSVLYLLFLYFNYLPFFTDQCSICNFVYLKVIVNVVFILSMTSFIYK